MQKDTHRRSSTETPLRFVSEGLVLEYYANRAEVKVGDDELVCDVFVAICTRMTASSEEHRHNCACASFGLTLIPYQKLSVSLASMLLVENQSQRLQRCQQQNTSCQARTASTTVLFLHNPVSEL
jgi:hypothetical protein